MLVAALAVGGVLLLVMIAISWYGAVTLPATVPPGPRPNDLARVREPRRAVSRRSRTCLGQVSSSTMISWHSSRHSEQIRASAAHAMAATRSRRFPQKPHCSAALSGLTRPR